MVKLKTVVLSMLLAFSLGLYGQSTSVPNVLNIKSRKSSGRITENGTVVGYYVFYFKEKMDKKNNAYEIKLFDDNFNSKKSFEIVRSKKSVLINALYNGSNFLFYFYDYKMGTELVTYDKSGKEVGKLITPIKEMSSYEKQRLQNDLNTKVENNSLFSIGDEGFVCESFPKNKKQGYELTAYDNKLKELWKISSPVDSKLIEIVDVVEVSEKYITGIVFRKKSLMTQSYDAVFYIWDIKTGKRVGEMSMGSESAGELTVLNSVYDVKDNSFIVVGEYYKPKANVVKDKSIGVYVKRLSDSGQEVDTKRYAWKGDIDKYKQEHLSAEDKKEANEKFLLYFHSVVISENGNVAMIGEQFKKQVSAGAVAGKLAVAALGGTSDVSNFEIRIGNMVVIEFDKDLSLTNFNVIEKKKSSVFLPSGAGIWSATRLANYVKLMGYFDYCFTSENKEEDKYSVVYLDMNRREEGSKEKAKVMLGVINIDKGVSTNNRIPLNSEAKYMWISKAKPGHVVINEYYRKEKKFDMHLEPIAY
jgi:hypothetical protein